MQTVKQRCRNSLGRLGLAFLLTIATTGLAAADPKQWKRAGFTTDFTKAIVDLKTIFSGGPPKDGIPSIDAPRFETARDISWLDDREPVIRLEVTGTIKAYPLQILIWHEIVNDRIGNVPVAITYCPLCNSSIAFDRRLGEETLDFGTTGLLRNSDLVMYDRQSETWWQQFTGEAIVGTHAGRKLKMLPSRVLSFGAFRKAHPEAEVLARPDPPRRDYGLNPYIGYDSRRAPYPLYQGDLPENINPMARVVIVRDAERFHAATVAYLRENGTLAFNGSVELRWTGEQASVLDNRSTRAGRSVGTVLAVRKTAAGEEPLVHDVTFAFVVHAFHPGLAILGVKQP
ncbi:DUF3179 domain-containing protein [Roseibium sp.]|uniref:DUF3179 domain-containing protein n=1 Tax=Roseibium sp. TaxID=1936156 RepID=UPI003D0E8774